VTEGRRWRWSCVVPARALPMSRARAPNRSGVDRVNTPGVGCTSACAAIAPPPPPVRADTHARAHLPRARASRAAVAAGLTTPPGVDFASACSLRRCAGAKNFFRRIASRENVCQTIITSRENVCQSEGQLGSNA
jgi:hypothetical protein